MSNSLRYIRRQTNTGGIPGCKVVTIILEKQRRDKRMMTFKSNAIISYAYFHVKQTISMNYIQGINYYNNFKMDKDVTE